MADEERRLDEEASRRANEVFKRGFYFEYGVTIAQPMEKIELLVAPFGGENAISLWFETAHGMFEMELLDPSGNVLGSLRDRRGEQVFTGVLVPGKYVLKLQTIGDARIHGVIGVKGSATQICHIEGARLTAHAADPAHGFQWPYLLARPAPVSAGAPQRLGDDRLLVVPNNTGVNEDLGVLHEAGVCTLADNGLKPLELANKLGTPVLVPLFPRPELKEVASNLELQALTRASLEEKDRRYAHVDLQLIAMIESARKELAEQGQPVKKSVLMVGFSASGGFANRFALLHPERVLAAAVGSPVGWPIAPVGSDQGETLRYPVGVADLQQLVGTPINLSVVRRVRFLFFLGESDANDAVGSSDSYSIRDSEQIRRLFGKTLIQRWRHAERLYERAGLLRARFRVCPGGHEVTPKMWDDVLDTFRRALRER